MPVPLAFIKIFYNFPALFLAGAHTSGLNSWLKAHIGTAHALPLRKGQPHTIPSLSVPK